MLLARSTPNFAYFAFCLFLSLLFCASSTYPPPVIGDGPEYLCMASNWADRHTPWLSEEYLQSCVRDIGMPKAVPSVGFVRHGEGQYDAVHFWLFSLLVSPFVAFCNLVGCLSKMRSCSFTWRFPRLLSADSW